MTKFSAMAVSVLCALPAGWACANPTYINASNTCLSCHSFTPASGGLSIEYLDGITKTSAPYSVTVVAGGSFTMQFRATGLYTSAFYPDTGGAIIPPDTSNWSVSAGPAWADNGFSGATPWIAPNTLFYRTDFTTGENTGGFPGLTCNDGRASAPADKNQIASDEVMSASVSLAPSLAPGTYPVTVAAMGHSASFPVSWTQSLSVIVVAPSPTITATQTPAPPGSTATETPTISPTFTESPTFSPSPTISPSWTPSPALSATPVPSNSFTAVLDLMAGPNPFLGGRVRLSYRLLAASQRVQARLYGPSLALVMAQDLGARPAGMNLESLEIPANLANQAYYLVLSAGSGRQDVRSRPVTLYVLR